MAQLSLLLACSCVGSILLDACNDLAPSHHILRRFFCLSSSVLADVAAAAVEVSRCREFATCIEWSFWTLRVLRPIFPSIPCNFGRVPVGWGFWGGIRSGWAHCLSESRANLARMKFGYDVQFCQPIRPNEVIQHRPVDFICSDRIAVLSEAKPPGKVQHMFQAEAWHIRPRHAPI